GRQINTIMQVCFFAVSGVLDKDQALVSIEKSIRKTYGKKGDDIVQMNLRAVAQTLENLHEVRVPGSDQGHVTERVNSRTSIQPPVPKHAPRFVVDVLGKMIEMKGDQLPVSALPCDGTYPVGTTKWQKRNLAQEIPVWDP